MHRLAPAFIMATLFTASTYAADVKCELQRIAELPVTMSGTQPVISGAINGKPLRFLADSGAFFSILSRETLNRLQLRELPMPYGLRVGGVGGTEQMGLTKVDGFSLVGLTGGRSYNGIEFMVSGGTFFGDLDGIIGQNILGIADAEYDLANGFIRMFQAKGCSDHSLAYWRGDTSVAEMHVKSRNAAEPHWLSEAKLNGKKIQVMFDSGASYSALRHGIAAKVGITSNSDSATQSGVTRGIGARQIDMSIARFDTLDLGGEVIKNARIQFGELKSTTDLILGADFFLSHRIYFATKQNKLYFTYNGGPVFDLRTNNADPNAPAAPSAVAAATSESAAGGTPLSAKDPITDAAGFRRRGTASMGRNDVRSALRDFDQAIKLDPNDAESYYERGKAYFQDSQASLALTDLDQALTLKPGHISARITRGTVRLAMKDETGARADFDKVMQLEPNDAGNALDIANIFMSFDLHAEAIARLSAWINTYPKDSLLPSALNSRCWSRAILGTELDLALADCNLAVKKTPRSSAYLDSRAFVYFRRGEYDKSIADYRAVLKLQPKQALSMYGLGLAELKKGLKTEGNQHLQAATALSPQVADFYKKLGLVP